MMKKTIVIILLYGKLYINWLLVPYRENPHVMHAPRKLDLYKKFGLCISQYGPSNRLVNEESMFHWWYYSRTLSFISVNDTTGQHSSMKLRLHELR